LEATKGQVNEFLNTQIKEKTEDMEKIKKDAQILKGKLKKEKVQNFIRSNKILVIESKLKDYESQITDQKDLVKVINTNYQTEVDYSKTLFIQFA